MKHFYNLILILFLFVSVNSARSQDTIVNNMHNFNIEDGTRFSFDIYALRITKPDFIMGNSSFIIKFTPGTLDSVTLTNINPKFTSGSPSGSYGPMICAMVGTPGNRRAVGVNVIYTSGSGDNISNDPGTFGIGERIATVNMKIQHPVPITLQWDAGESGIINPNFHLAASRYFGIYNGTLPVELSSFNSTVTNNNVNLKWTTASEQNNSGFDIERRSVEGNTQWTKIGFEAGSGNSSETKSYSFNDNSLNTGKYSYRLKQIDFNGNFEYFELQNDVIIGVPSRFELSQNYPNPFNPSTKINFSLPFDSKVTLKIYDISGKLVSTLINNEFKTADYYTVNFNGVNLSSGTYFYSLQSGDNIDTKKMVLIK
ncbi:MAG: T9SS type A sorting domain-containing protein [Bacteroidetes bacterium]|nr:T9SS type A sorting domain-containing protein [Bacteroidota bacterium]